MHNGKAKLPGKYLSRYFHLIVRNKYKIIVIFILLLGFFLRFYNFENRWSLGNDDSRDISIAREALDRGEWPLIGSFSSAGPFVFGPFFYWTLMLGFILLPGNFYAPVIVTAISSGLVVAVLMYAGYLLGGRRLAIICGLLSATSPQLVSRALSVGQHSYIALFASLTILFFILFWQKRKMYFPFLMGLSIGCALSFHYQAINILIFFPALLFVPKIKFAEKIVVVFIALAGFIIPSLPLLIWDSRQGFANTNNILDYLLIAQYRIYVPNSWSLFIFKYLPDYWAMVTGKFYWIALAVMFFTFILLLFQFIKKKITGVFLVLMIIFSALLFLNRFYKGERSEGYLIYFAPFIIIFTSWLIVSIVQFGLKKNKRVFKYIGYFLFIIILSGNFYASKQYLSAENQMGELRKVVQVLVNKYPNSKFSIYDYTGHSGYQSQSLSLMLKTMNKTDPNGIKIGVTCSSIQCMQGFPGLTKFSGENVVLLNKKTEKYLRRTKWIKVNQEDMYDDLIGWSKRNELKTTFSLNNFILEKFNLKNK